MFFRKAQSDSKSSAPSSLIDRYLISKSIRTALWSQYHLRKQVDPMVKPTIKCLTHPLTRVALTSCSKNNSTLKAFRLSK